MDTEDIDDRILDAVAPLLYSSIRLDAEAINGILASIQEAQDAAVKEALETAERESAEKDEKLASLSVALHKAIDQRKTTYAALVKQMAFNRMNDEFVHSLIYTKNPFKRLAYKMARWPAPSDAKQREKYIVTVDVLAEMARQDEKWGEQNHANGTGEKFGFSEQLADAVRQRTDDSFERGTGTWADILMEEFYEAMAEDNPRKLKEELLQVAAVALQWVAAINRQRKG